MSNYFYKWIPLVIVGTVFLLGLPWLGLIALFFVAGVLLSALAALALAITSAVETTSRAVGRLWHGRSAAHGMAHALAPVLVTHTPSERDA